MSTPALRRPLASVFATNSAFIACGIVLIVLASMYVAIDWSYNPDWRGYLNLFFLRGAWLALNGRDPAFVAFVDWSGVLFRGNYELWRDYLFLGFLGGIAATASRMPAQRSAQVMSIAVVLIAAFLLKSLVQIREGLAMLFLVAGIAPVFSGKRKLVWSLPFVATAFLFHNGTLGYVLAVGAAALLGMLPRQDLLKPSLSRFLFIAAAGAGTGLAIFLNTHSVEVINALSALGADTTTRFRSVFLKWVYWALMGVLMLAVRNHTLRAIRAAEPGLAFGLVIASGLLPAFYFSALMLNLMAFQAPVLTGLFVRGLATALETSLLIVLWRGRGDWVTALLATVILADRIRAISAVV